MSHVVGGYYDPATGQFLTVDPLVDDTAVPYAYAGGDPMIASDPAGLYFGQGIVDTLSNAAVGTAKCIGDIANCLSPQGAANAAVSFFNSIYAFVTNGEYGPGLSIPYPCNPYLSESNAFGQGLFLGAGFAIPGLGEENLATLEGLSRASSLEPTLLGATSKGAAREALAGASVTPEQLATASRAIARATSNDTLSLVMDGSNLVVTRTRPGFDGVQVIVSVIDEGGTSRVTQLAFDSTGRLVHYDPKTP